MSKDNIVDTAKPSAGRIYDYFLGGNHNFEVDRQAGDQISKLLPYAVKASRLQRWTLQDIAVEFTEKRGYDAIIDFASGLPTGDHIHSKVPKGTTVIYSDYDPVVVEYAKEILNGVPDVYFFEADARAPEQLLERPELIKILNGRRKVAFGFWGIDCNLPDDAISHFMQYLYDWAAPGSCMALNAQVAELNPQDPDVIATFQIYEAMGTKICIHSLKDYETLMQPWRLDGNFIPLLEWHGFDQSELSKEETKTWGLAGASYGAYLVK